MTGVLGLSELLLEQRLTDSVRGQVQQIRSSAFSLVTIINDILDFTRLESGQVVLQPEAVQLRGAIETSLVRVRFQAEAADLLLSLELSPGLPEWVSIDATKLGQVIQNLAGNAVKFTERGTVRVIAEELRRAGDEVSLDFVSWTQERGSLWPSSRRSSASSCQSDPGSAEGLGLGLPIVQQIVHVMGGTIRLESEVGVGSTFTVTLPLQVVGAPQSRVGGPASLGEHDALAVLVAEDNEVNRSLIVRILEKLGLLPVVAHDGLEAVEECRKARFDLILMDYRMPNLNGVEAAAQIRAPSKKLPRQAVTRPTSSRSPVMRPRPTGKLAVRPG